MCRVSLSPRVKVVCRAIRSTFVVIPPATTFIAMAYVIRVGMRATPSASIVSKSTRARHRLCSVAARPAVRSTSYPSYPKLAISPSSKEQHRRLLAAERLSMSTRRSAISQCAWPRSVTIPTLQAAMPRTSSAMDSRHRSPIRSTIKPRTRSVISIKMTTTSRIAVSPCCRVPISERHTDSQLRYRAIPTLAF